MTRIYLQNAHIKKTQINKFKTIFELLATTANNDQFTSTQALAWGWEAPEFSTYMS